MWSRSYWAGRFFAPRYWPDVPTGVNEGSVIYVASRYLNPGVQSAFADPLLRSLYQQPGVQSGINDPLLKSSFRQPGVQSDFTPEE